MIKHTPGGREIVNRKKIVSRKEKTVDCTHRKRDFFERRSFVPRSNYFSHFSSSNGFGNREW